MQNRMFMNGLSGRRTGSLKREAMSGEDAEERQVVPLEAFAACPLEAPVAELNHTDLNAFSHVYEQAAAAAATSPCQSVYALLAALCGIHLDPAARGNVWIPGISIGFRRSMIPSDIAGPQSDILEAQLALIQSPALRARLADIVWSNNLRKGSAAKSAIESYCDCIDGLISGHLIPRQDMEVLGLADAQRLAQRALQISSATSKRNTMPQRLKDTVSSLYDENLKRQLAAPFARVAQLSVDYHVHDIKRVADDLEGIVAESPSVYPEALRIALDYASILRGKLGDTDGQERCQLAAIRQLLRMRDECAQAGAKASWVMDALLRLRALKSEEAQALEAELEIELRLLQKAALREMGSFPISLDVPEERERILAHFSEIDLASALRDYASLPVSPAVSQLKAEALEEAGRSGISSIFGIQYVDQEGRTVVRTPSLGSGEPSEEWFAHAIGRSENLRRALVVTNSIEPVRQLINSKVAIEERHLDPIVWQSPVVPKTQASLYAIGFTHFFQGNFPSAAHVLIPQLEPSLRYLLKTHGVDPTKRRDDATEEDRSLDSIIINHRTALEGILGADLLDGLNRLFNVQPGPNLRHEMAHGQISANECYTADIIYACWFLYRLVSLPLVQNWDAWVRPNLKDEGLPGVQEAANCNSTGDAPVSDTLPRECPAASMAEKIAAWQDEFDVIRDREPLRSGGLVSRRLRVLPPWGSFMHRSFGAAFVFLSRIYVDRRVLDAPPEVRQYLLLHEWGHVVRRHNQVAMLSACVLPFVFFPQAFIWLHARPGLSLAPIAGLGLLATCIQAALSVWMMSDMRELEADAYAASVIGPAAVLDGIGWVAAWSRQGWTAGRRKRRAALWQAVLAAGTDRV
jgi:hypothetical protein